MLLTIALASRVAALLWFLVAPSAALGGQFDGVLYSDVGGVSGTSRGRVQLCSGGKIMTLHYQRPYMANYKEVAGTGLAPGAKWRVKFNSSSRRLSRAWYIGGDSNIQRAFDTLRQFCRAFKEDHKEAAQKVLGADVADKVFEDWWKSLRSAGLDGTAATAPSCSAILRASMQTVLVAVDGLCVGAKFRSKVAIFEIASEQAEWRIRKITYRDQHYTDLLLADGDACFTTSLGAPRR